MKGKMLLLLLSFCVLGRENLIGDPIPKCTDCKYVTHKTPAVNLKSGQIANTPNTFGGPLPWVEGAHVVRHFHAQVVDDNGQTVPLTELYVHHWLIFANDDSSGVEHLGKHNGGFCTNLQNVFGIGAELMGTGYDYPDGYGIVMSGKETWTANLHFIRTTNVESHGASLQECIECRCPGSNPPQDPRGNVACCVDRHQCYGMKDWTKDDAKNYYLQYTIGYVTDATNIKPLTVYTMDVTGNSYFDCAIQYNVPALADGAKNVWNTTWDFPIDLDVVYMEVHQHIGGENYIIDHIPKASGKSKTICSVAPTYGTGDKVGNEKDYLVAEDTCHWNTEADVLHMKRGDKLAFQSIYSNRGLAGGNKWHSGVMGLVFIAGHPLGPASPLEECTKALATKCGTPPYKGGSKGCEQCAEDNRQALEDAYCTVDLVKALCSKAGGNLPVPPQVPGVSANVQYVKTVDGNELHISMLGPVDSWFGVGVNNKAQMDGAVAWIYSNGDAGGTKPFVSERFMGNHQPGNSTGKESDIDIKTTTKGSHVEVVMVLDIDQHLPTNKTFDKQVCWLFAQGDDMKFAYHGSKRGTYCYNPNNNVFDRYKDVLDPRRVIVE